MSFERINIPEGCSPFQDIIAILLLRIWVFGGRGEERYLLEVIVAPLAKDRVFSAKSPLVIIPFSFLIDFWSSYTLSVAVLYSSEFSREKNRYTSPFFASFISSETSVFIPRMDL